jgi:maltose alpha-D-glucosyltransferase/alpha-amylase
MKRIGSASDPLWYKDAVIYELHVKAFFDSNNDGIGDFSGLIQKLDYLQDLGVTCLWLLPFFPSPLKDDGYDISDYLNIHPSYGTMEDFKTFLSAAHERNLQVLIELVVNHTSDQHPWFQAARAAPHGSPERDFYVWSDTPERFKDARIIFSDTEKSNWTWDPVAHAYYWHRFFSHQPDLNFDNPLVIEEVLKVLRHWLDLGVDAIRLDAIPYLVERDLTNCENLPETHAVIKRIRAEIDTYYANRMILAEANQWPSDVRPYFGDGDECHMTFHFPLMPRIYMALRQEDRLPIIDIMAQTPEIPDTCQWGLFLRNHDELTLEMVTNDERDYMYLAYSADPRMRINLGIRRRLAPLVDNNRRRIELLNSLLCSFPGTPIIYYGDEIGMGDNIYLGDRNGVRTPMQWTGDRNAGFSRATPGKLYSPVVMDPVFGYEAINVEAQQSDQASLLNWMRNMIALRKLFRVFGRGSLAFLNPSNRKILAYIRKYDEEQVLCIANLSRFAQPVDVDLPGLEGMVPIEMLGYVEFPPIGRQPYRLTLAPYGFLWLELHKMPQTAPAEIPVGVSEEILLSLSNSWASLFEGSAKNPFQGTVLPEYMAKQAWFSSESRRIEAIQISDWGLMEGLSAAVCLIAVQYESGPMDTYLLPLAMSFGRKVEDLEQIAPQSVVSAIHTPDGEGVLYDCSADDDFASALLKFIGGRRELKLQHGHIRGLPGAALSQIQGEYDGRIGGRRAVKEKKYSSILHGDKFILKLFRRCEPSPNPEVELEKHLTENVHFDGILPFAGSLEYLPADTEPSTLAMVQLVVPNEGDGWKWTLEEVERYYENCVKLPFPENAPTEKASIFELSEQPVSPVARDYLGIYLDSAETLGRRTAQMHLALASSDTPALSPEPMTPQDVLSLIADLRARAAHAFDVLKKNISRLADEVVEPAGLVLGRRRWVFDGLNRLDARPIRALRTRIHGNYHLGNVLRAKNDYIIVVSEGEPTVPLAQRRAKQSPLKDVAGMLRSFSYAAYATLMAYTARRAEDLASLTPWARLWISSAASAFLRAYRETAETADFLPADPQDFRELLQAYVVDRALHELLYELNNRPTWARIPLEGILSLPL